MNAWSYISLNEIFRNVFLILKFVWIKFGDINKQKLERIRQNWKNKISFESNSSKIMHNYVQCKKKYSPIEIIDIV